MATYRAYIAGPRRSWQSRLQLAVAAVIGLGILFGALVVSLSIAMVLIPVAAIAYLFRRQILRGVLRSVMVPRNTGAPGAAQQRSAAAQPRSAGPVDDGKIIDVDYRVVPPGDRSR
jgi:hypothetical protein